MSSNRHANALSQKRVDNTRISWLVSGLNDVLKFTEVCLLKLVVEHAVCLTELKRNVKQRLPPGEAR